MRKRVWKLIRIDPEVTAYLQSRLTDELNTPNKVLRDILGLPPYKGRKKALTVHVGYTSPMIAIFVDGRRIRIF